MQPEIFTFICACRSYMGRMKSTLRYTANDNLCDTETPQYAGRGDQRQNRHICKDAWLGSLNPRALPSSPSSLSLSLCLSLWSLFMMERMLTVVPSISLSCCRKKRATTLSSKQFRMAHTCVLTQ